MDRRRRIPTVVELLETIRRRYFRHQIVHESLTENSPIREQVFAKFPSKGCPECYPLGVNNTKEFITFLRSIEDLDISVTQYTAEAFETFVTNKTRENALALLQTIGFRNFPVKPEKLITTLLNGEFNFEFPYSDIGDYITDPELDELRGQVKIIIRKQEKAEEPSSSASTSKPPSRTQAFTNYLFNRSFTTQGPVTPARVEESDEELEEGEIPETTAELVTPVGTPERVENYTGIGETVTRQTQFAENIYQTHYKPQLLQASTSTPNLPTTFQLKDIANRKEKQPEGVLVVQTQDDTVIKQKQKKKQVAKPQAQPQVQPPLPQIVPLPQVQPQVQPPPPQNLLPPQQPDDEEEMSQAHYPTFDGTNPRKWIAEVELAFIANNIAADANARRIGIAALNLGPARMWYMTLANQPVEWTHAGDGFKQIFLAKYAANGNRAQAAQQAFSRMQKTTESVNDYLNALQGMWMECGDANMPEWLKVNQFVNGLLPQLRMPVLQQAPQTMNDAVQYATNCYYAMQSTIQPANVIDTTYQTMLAAVQELLKETRNNNNQRGNSGDSNNNNQFQPRQRQEMRNTACYYCGKRGHAYRNCRILALHRRENREQQWAMPQRNQGPQGKGQPRH